MSHPRFNGALARQRRITVGFSVEQVASHVGKSPKSIYAYEGKRDINPPPPVRRKMESLYGLAPGELLTTENDSANGSEKENAA